MIFNLKAQFPNASADTVAANPHLSDSAAVTPTQPKINYVQPILKRKKAKHEANHHRKIQDSKPEHHQTPALDSTDAGEAEGAKRVIVRFVGYRVRHLDPDNFAGGCKDLLDALRHSRLIHGDEWWRITLETSQVKVCHFEDEETLIEIETP